MCFKAQIGDGAEVESIEFIARQPANTSWQRMDESR